MVGALAAVGLAISLLLQRPWYEGAAAGSVAGAFVVHFQASNEQFREYSRYERSLGIVGELSEHQICELRRRSMVIA